MTWVLVLFLLLAGCASGSDPTGNGLAGGTSEEVTVPAEGLELSGTLRLPDGEPPFPTVVVVHGSGPQSRHGTMQGQLGLTLPRAVDVYDELAEGLQARGYAVFTWDKRTCGPFNGCAENGYTPPPEDLTFEVFGDDLAAVLVTLEARPDVGELIVAGHSKGGTVAAELLSRGASPPAAVVLLGTPAVPIDEVIATQAETLAELVAAAGQQGTVADQAVAQVRELAAEVAQVAQGELDGAPIGGASRGFWWSWIEASRRAPEHVHEAAVPVLALGGGRDWNVPAWQVEAWEPSLPEGSAVLILPELTHALTRLGRSDPAAISSADVGTKIEPVLIDSIATWLDEVLER